MKIHINVPENFDRNEVQHYTLQSVPAGHAVFCDFLDIVLVPNASRDQWISFGMNDNGIDTIDDDVNSVTGIAFNINFTIWVAK